MVQQFMKLDTMAQEYRRNAAVLELRVAQLKHQLAHTSQLELRRRLKHRIGVLHVLSTRRAAPAITSITITRGGGTYADRPYGRSCGHAGVFRGSQRG